MDKELKTNKEELTNWMDKEQKELENNAFDGERLPALKLEEGVITTVEVDFSKPFERWEDSEKGTIKKLVPVVHNGDNKIWWLNVKNPVYAEIISGGLKGEKTFDVLQSGKQEKTRYTLIKREKK